MDINELCSILRLYTDLHINSTAIYEEIAYELELRFDQLTQEGFVNSLIAMKLAPTQKIKSIRNELEALMIENI